MNKSKSAIFGQAITFRWFWQSTLFKNQPEFNPPPPTPLFPSPGFLLLVRIN